MWIGEFSQAAGLNVATVRFYVRSGLLHPRLGSVGGSRPYMEFSQKDLRTLNAIRAGQAMGMSLAEIKLLASERRVGGKQQMLQAMTAQRDKLELTAGTLTPKLSDRMADIRGRQWTLSAATAQALAGGPAPADARRVSGGLPRRRVRPRRSVARSASRGWSGSRSRWCLRPRRLHRRPGDCRAARPCCRAPERLPAARSRRA